MKNSLLHDKKLDIHSFSICLLIVTCLAFYDIKPIFLGAQALAILMTLLFLKIDNKAKIYIIWGSVFSVLSFLSIIWAAPNNGTLFRVSLSVVQVLLIGFCVEQYVSITKKFLLVIKTIIVSSLIICLRFYVSIPVSYWGNQERIEKNTIFGTNTPYLLMAFSAVFLLWFIMFNNCAKKTKFFCAVLSSFLLFTSTLNGTKKSLLIFLIGLVVFLLSKAKNVYESVKKMILALLLILLLFFLINNVTFLYNTIGYRFDSLFDFLVYQSGDKSSEHRYSFALAALKVFVNHPILGVGQDGFRYLHFDVYSHCNYTELLANLGLLGFLAYYCFYWQLLRQLFRSWKKNTLPFAVIITILIMDFFNISFANELIFILLGCIYATN